MTPGPLSWTNQPLLVRFWLPRTVAVDSTKSAPMVWLAPRPGPAGIVPGVHAAHVGLRQHPALHAGHRELFAGETQVCIVSRAHVQEAHVLRTRLPVEL